MRHSQLEISSLTPNRVRLLLLPLLPAALLLACCAGPVQTAEGDRPPHAAPAPQAFRPATVWAEPIRDYVAVGERAFPDGFNRAITALTAFDDGVHPPLLWVGYGDANTNMGSETPIEFRYFISPDDSQHRIADVLADKQGAPQRCPTDTGEEQIDQYRVAGYSDGAERSVTLWQAGIDSNNPDEAWTQAKPAPARLIEGNIFRLEYRQGLPVWRKFRSIPGGEHVHDIVEFDGALWAVGSGAANRDEWEGGRIFRYLWKSEDGGETFRVAHRVMYPDLGKGDARFRQLLVVGNTLYAFGYINPFVEGGPLEGRHIAVRDGRIEEVSGNISRLVVRRTWPLAPDLGLVVTMDRETGSSRAFLANEAGFDELKSWAPTHVVDLCSGFADGEFLLLCHDRERADRFAVYRIYAGSPEERERLLDVPGVECTAIALWHNDLYIGTADGRILRAEAAGRLQGR